MILCKEDSSDSIIKITKRRTNMKKSLFFIAVVLCSCLNAFSQATSLTIDCQTPGWLASYINPTEAQNIRSLTVTGVINSTDLATIGNLVKNYQLNERLDLENVDIEGNYLSGDMFGVSDCQLQFLSLPLSVTKLENCVNWVKLDTLVCGSEIFKCFQNRYITYTPYVGSQGYYEYASNEDFQVKHLILREGVVYYESGIGSSSIEEIVFPNSLKYIISLSGSNLSKINIPPAVEHLGEIIGTKLNLNGDTLYIPNTVKCLYDRWGTGGYRNGYLGSSNRDENGKIKCIYLPEGLDTLWVRQLYGYSGSPYTDPGAKVDIHIKAKTPPRVQNGTLGYNTIVYVPVGYKDVYKGTGGSSGTSEWGGATIMEEVYAEQIEIDAPKRLYVGDSQKLKVEFTPYNVSFKDATWSVSDSEILSLTQDGTCTALSYGTVQVTAINADRSCSDTKTIKVYDHTTGVNISKNALKLTVGEKATLIANTLPIGTSDEMITWSTNDELVATVDDKGKIRGIGRGTCTINATSVDGGYTATCEVTVTQSVEALALEKHSLTLKIGETERLYVQIAPLLAGNKTVNWSSADEEVASVDSMGTVKALAAGETWIRAVSDDNPEAKDSCHIVVPDIPAPAPNGDCATPTIMVSGNKMTFECETPDAEFTSYLTTSEEFSGGEVVIENKDITFTLTVYAIAPGYDRSKPATMKFTVKKSDVNGDGHIDVADIATIIDEMAARVRMQEETEE